MEVDLQSLDDRAKKIADEKYPQQNTAIRVGSLFRDIVNLLSTAFQRKITTGDQIATARKVATTSKVKATAKFNQDTGIFEFAFDIPTGAAGETPQISVDSATHQLVINSIPSGVSLLGLPGSPGVKGEPGIKGDTGAIGAIGPIGHKGDTPQISISPSSFQLLVDGNAVGPGLRGPQGAQGPAGFTGEPGQMGVSGIQGIQGIQGDSGADGHEISTRVDTALFGPMYNPVLGAFVDVNFAGGINKVIYSNMGFDRALVGFRFKIAKIPENKICYIAIRNDSLLSVSFAMIMQKSGAYDNLIIKAPASSIEYTVDPGEEFEMSIIRNGLVITVTYAPRLYKMQ